MSFPASAIDRCNNLTSITPHHSKSRIGWIDIAKCFCIISVILGHLGVNELGFVYSFHLTTFFILSGYTLRKTPVNKEYLKNKFVRLMSPYFITCFAVMLMDLITLIVVKNNYSITSFTETIYNYILKTFFASGGQNLLGNIDLGKGIGAIWFLPAMFFALVSTQIILNSFSSRLYQYAAGICLSVISAISAQIIWLPFSVQAGLFAIPFILFGTTLKEYDILSKLKLWQYCVFAFIFLLGCIMNVAQGFYMVNCYMQDWLFTPICAICSSLLIIGLSKLINKCAPLEFVGKNSLLILCVHLFEMNTLYPYYIFFLNLLGLQYVSYIHLILEVISITIISSAILYIKSIYFNYKSKSQINTLSQPQKRSPSIDIMRAFLIILMIIGHSYYKYWGLSKFIYSFHMMAFVIISGYFYKKQENTCEALLKSLKSLIPYAIFGILFIIFTNADFKTNILTVICGISFTKNLLTEIPAIGPAYFILLLFLVKVIYIFIDKCDNAFIKNFIVLGTLILSVYLNNFGFWLPWSFDCALFSIIFYHLGVLLRKFDILNKCKEIPWIYFVLSCIWAFMIFSGAMEIAMRNYGNLGITILGVLSAFIISYLLCENLSTILPKFIIKTLTLIGQSTLHILIFHTLFSGKINDFLQNSLYLNSQNIFHLGFSVIIQVLIGVLIFLIIKYLKYLKAQLFSKKHN